MDKGEVLSVLFTVCRWSQRSGYAYQEGGSFPSSVHGVPRQTRGIDLVVDLPDAAAPAIERDFSDEFYVDAIQVRRAVREGRSFNLVHLETGLKVGVFFAGETEFDAIEVERSVEVVFDEHSGESVSVKFAEDNVLRKRLWYEQAGRLSDQQWTDVLGVVMLQGESLDCAHLQAWPARLGIGEVLERALTDVADSSTRIATGRSANGPSSGWTRRRPHACSGTAHSVTRRRDAASVRRTRISPPCSDTALVVAVAAIPRKRRRERTSDRA